MSAAAGDQRFSVAGDERTGKKRNRERLRMKTSNGEHEYRAEVPC